MIWLNWTVEKQHIIKNMVQYGVHHVGHKTQTAKITNIITFLQQEVNKI